MNTSHPFVTFCCDVDLKTCIDSMLFDSGTILASMEFEDKGVEIEIDLIVHGEVHVCVLDENENDKDYRKPSEFPEELVNEIKTNPDWENAENIVVLNNNWFEFIYTVDDNWSDGEMCDDNLATLTPDDLKEKMSEICQRLCDENAEEE